MRECAGMPARPSIDWYTRSAGNTPPLLLVNLVRSGGLIPE
jgi:hypothetical protein